MKIGPQPGGRLAWLMRAIRDGLGHRGTGGPDASAGGRTFRLGLGGMLLIALGTLAAGKTAIMVGDLRHPVDAGGRLDLSEPAPERVREAWFADQVLAEPAAGPNDADPLAEDDAVSTTEADARPPPDRATAAPLDPASLGPGELEALGELFARRAALDERERELELRAALLADAEAKLTARLSDLEALKATIEAMLNEHDDAEEAKLASLVKIYESMKPKAAAEIFDRLDMSVLLSVVSRMREGVASEIIGRMSPERAEQLTAELARRRRIPGHVDEAGARGAGT